MSISTDPEDWIRRFHPNPEARIRLICLPHAGGSAPFYFPVSRALAPRAEVLAVQYPGRMDRRRETMIDEITALCDAVFQALEPALRRDPRPFAVFGHSMGATVGYELARRCEAAGLPPTRLFASGRRAPSRQLCETVHQRDDAGLIADIKRLSGTDDRVFGDEELLAMLLPAIRNDYRAAETYVHRRPERTLHCPITVLTGDRDPKVDLESAEAWSEHTTAPCELLVYPGGHFYLVPRAQEVLAVITERLAQDAGAEPALAAVPAVPAGAAYREGAN